ncbi:MAG: DNA repair exonuclease, partial [Deinococcales bacterium]|nr:DNA repair exonuclease [Deinococcales bacterium]
DPPSARVLRHEQVSYFVDRVRVEALPELDLAALARGDDPVGLLAARIEALRQPGSPLRERLVSAARPRLVEAARAKAFAGLEPPALDEAEVAALLEEAALRALDALLSQPGSAA